MIRREAAQHSARTRNSINLAAKALATVLCVTLAACVARPVGDFGRAAPSFTHDTAMPAVGQVIARNREEPVSTLNLTDIEQEMRDRTWRFLVASHAEDWFQDVTVELQRTRITAIGSKRLGVDRYYNWLHSTRFSSSEIRYAAMKRHVLADLDTLPATFAAICAVRDIDRQRALAASGLPVGAEHVREANARISENEMRIAWFANALDYRYRSYEYALDYLIVETPHAASVAVDVELQRLEHYVVVARSDQFCFNGGAGAVAGAGTAVIRSRYATPPREDFRK
ncbi:hypothetical protein GCM10007989_26310 [Devosia pacifica]|uniref:Uncharacterized protein n=1 Tax=Devosia pacifica TaxID=1335967 RepID=A0A918S7X6_9HYPH|nr:hypothetical protein [Devosia pacifica]GHA29457.1 hypothetical protein GCM10007989_26310 [Devosia pacifica]